MRWLADQDDADPDTSPAPETPAPIFALRAFKSTIFGSPDYEEEHRAQRDNADTSHPKLHLAGLEKEQESNMATGKAKRTPMKSPSKSCLVTPGTKRSERKIVAFRDAPPRTTAATKKKDLEVEISRSCPKGDELDMQAVAMPQALPSPLIRKAPQPPSSRSPLRQIENNQLSPSPKQRPPRNSPANLTKAITPANQNKTQLAISPHSKFKIKESSPVPAQDATPSSTPKAKAKVHLHHPRNHSSTSSADARHLRRLLQRYEIVKQYAKMKDDEATNLALRVKKLEDENIKLVRELEALRGPQHAAERSERVELGQYGTIAGSTSTPILKSNSTALENREKRTPRSRPSSLRSTAAVAGTAPKVPNLSPDRVAAAKARLKIKAEERKKAAVGTAGPH